MLAAQHHLQLLTPHAVGGRPVVVVLLEDLRIGRVQYTGIQLRGMTVTHVRLNFEPGPVVVVLLEDLGGGGEQGKRWRYRSTLQLSTSHTVVAYAVNLSEGLLWNP